MPSASTVPVTQAIEGSLSRALSTSAIHVPCIRKSSSRMITTSKSSGTWFKAWLRCEELPGLPLITSMPGRLTSPPTSSSDTHETMIRSGLTVCESTKPTTRSSNSARPRVGKITQTFASLAGDGRLVSLDMVTPEQTIGSKIHLVGQCILFWKPENRGPSFTGLDRPDIANGASHSSRHFEDHDIDRADAALLPTPRKCTHIESRKSFMNAPGNPSPTFRHAFGRTLRKCARRGRKQVEARAQLEHPGGRRSDDQRRD